MAESLNFELVSPERLLVSDQVDHVTVPGMDGDFTVLARHAPLISTIRPGLLTVAGGSASGNRIFVRGGIAEVNPRGLIVLAEEAVPIEEIDREALAQDIRNARDDVNDARDDDARNKAQEILDGLLEMEDVVRHAT